MEPEPASAQLVSTRFPLFDEARLAVGGFLARYSGNTRTGYASDLRGWFAWSAQVDLEPFGTCRGSARAAFGDHPLSPALAQGA